MIHALVPSKSLDQAKGRLASLLSEGERRSLALAMLEDVVRALQAVPRIDSITVVSPDASVRALTARLGAKAIEEPPSVRGINQALAHGLESIGANGSDSLLVVLADVPAVTPAEIDSIIDAISEGKGVVVSPSAANGTSILALRPANAIPFRFGPDSFAAHKREAMARGIKAKVLRIDSVSHDIDEPEDIRNLISHPAETATQTLLAQLHIADRLA